MKNRYGVQLDKNGYAPSIMQNYDRCFLCYKRGDLIRHEVFNGDPNRTRSKALGIWVQLCPKCHEELHAHKRDDDRRLKEIGQMAAMDHYDWTVEEFRAEFGKSWL